MVRSVEISIPLDDVLKRLFSGELGTPDYAAGFDVYAGKWQIENVAIEEGGGLGIVLKSVEAKKP